MSISTVGTLPYFQRIFIYLYIMAESGLLVERHDVTCMCCKAGPVSMGVFFLFYGILCFLP